ncbi:MAG: PrkA family serine protein kinase, partial [Gammaproteobacteria bacterium]
MSIFEHYRSKFDELKEEELTLQEYLDLCKKDPLAYASPAERMLNAIGEPELLDTHNDPRLSRLFSNKV